PRRARRAAGRPARLRRAPRPCLTERRPGPHAQRLAGALLLHLGTTRDPKAVLHTHAYPIAHRYTGEYWLDLQRTDLHWTTSDTGWAKAAYGVLFGPWMHGVPVFMFNGRFDPERQLDLLARYEVSVFCAPPTEYRLLVKQDL